MKMTKEIMGCSSITDRSTFLYSSSSSSIFNPVMVPLRGTERRKVELRRNNVRSVPAVAAISEDLMKAVVPEKAAKFKVRAVVTVRKNIKEDFKETIVNRIDAITDIIGRNVVLELVSTEVDPSKFLFSLVI